MKLGGGVTVEIKGGDTASIHYTGTLIDGTVFDSSEGRDPLDCVVGSGQIIPGLGVALPGMQAVEKKVVKIDCTEACGPINPAMRQAVPRDAIPQGILLELGLQLQMQTPEGQSVTVTFAEIAETEIRLDANRPLAGKDLTLDFEVVLINPL